MLSLLELKFLHQHETLEETDLPAGPLGLVRCMKKTQLQLMAEEVRRPSAADREDDLLLFTRI